MSNTDKHTHSAGDRRQAESATATSVRMRSIRGGKIFAAAAAVLALATSEAMAVSNAGEFVIAREMARENGRLTVNNEPLIKVIDEMNRGAERKLIVDRSDPRLRELLITGQFRAERPEVLVDYIRAAGIRVYVTKDSEGNIHMRLQPESRS